MWLTALSLFLSSIVAASLSSRLFDFSAKWWANTSPIFLFSSEITSSSDKILAILLRSLSDKILFNFLEISNNDSSTTSSFLKAELELSSESYPTLKGNIEILFVFVSIFYLKYYINQCFENLFTLLFYFSMTSSIYEYPLILLSLQDPVILYISHQES